MGRHKRHFLSFALAVPPTAAWRATLRRGRAAAGLSPETYNLKRSALWLEAPPPLLRLPPTTDHHRTDYRFTGTRMSTDKRG
jgi:hypothetical protein